jgi:hypothetical protein
MFVAVLDSEADLAAMMKRYGAKVTMLTGADF